MTIVEKIDSYFKIKERGSTIYTEFRGAISTFLTVAYILAVNPRILADSGGTCEYGEGGPFSPEYELCLEETKRQMVVATALASMVACLIMGLWANLPIALSCGMGMNAYFTYNVVGFRGFGSVSYGAALAAVLIEGIVFFILAVTGLRFWIIKNCIPDPVRHSVPAAIGAFLAHLGLQTAEGIGVVVSDVATSVTLGGCSPEHRTPMVALDDGCLANPLNCVTSDAYTCDVLGGHMESPTTWLGIAGTVLMAILLAYKINSSFMIGIGLITIISWFRGTTVTYFSDDFLGNSRFEYFKEVVAVESLSKIIGKWDFTEAKGGDFVTALFTLLYVDFFDTSGTLLAIVSSMGLVNEDGDFENSRAAFTTDAIATMFGSIFGLSPLTSYIESAAGVEAGSRTGLTSVFVAFFFFLSIFFAPIFSSIPAWATGGSLVVVGALMCRSLVKVHWGNPAHAVCAFVTVIVMPLTYSIAYGLIAGIGLWVAIKAVAVPLNMAFGIPDPTVIVTEGEEKKEKVPYRGLSALEGKKQDIKGDSDDDIEA
jgi:AGZA family xanthine/uracil permease-like MFS transporter